jgi:hypothetical protein
LRDQRPEVGLGRRGQAHEDGGEAVVVRLGEEEVRVAGDEGRLLGLVAHAHGEHLGVRHSRLLRMDSLHPDPDEALLLALAEDAEREAAPGLARTRQRQRDPAHVLLAGHSLPLYTPGGQVSKS